MASPFMLRRWLSQGHHVEQYRLYEVLASGAIPVIIAGKGTLERQLPASFLNSPAIIERNLPRALARIKKLLSDHTRLRAEQDKVLSWYHTLMTDTLQTLDAAMLEHFLVGAVMKSAAWTGGGNTASTTSWSGHHMISVTWFTGQRPWSLCIMQFWFDF